MRAIQSSHCLNGHVKKGDQDMDFSVCLTCKKGTASHSCEGHGQRWVSLHAKKTACRDAHAAALSVFNSRLSAAKAAAAAAAPVAEDPVPPSGDSVASLWEECKSNKKMTVIVTEIEASVLAASEEFDDEPCFKPEEGFKEVIFNAIGYRRDIDTAKQKMEDLVAKHDDEIRELRGVIRKQVDTIRCLETMVKDQQCELVHLRAENTRLRKEIEELQDENNALRMEISQMRAEITQLREENTKLREENVTLRSEVGSLKDEMALMRAQMTAMQKEFDAYKTTNP